MPKVMKITDENGTVVAAREYDAFGNVLSETGTWRSRFAFHPNWIQLKDGGGRFYITPGGRIYDTVIGRFLSRDPLAGLAGGYDYALANPVTNVDPTGLQPCEAGSGGRELEPIRYPRLLLATLAQGRTGDPSAMFRAWFSDDPVMSGPGISTKSLQNRAEKYVNAMKAACQKCDDDECFKQLMKWFRFQLRLILADAELTETAFEVDALTSAAHEGSATLISSVGWVVITTVATAGLGSYAATVQAQAAARGATVVQSSQKAVSAFRAIEAFKSAGTITSAQSAALASQLTSSAHRAARTYQGYKFLRGAGFIVQAAQRSAATYGAYKAASSVPGRAAAPAQAALENVPATTTDLVMRVAMALADTYIYRLDLLSRDGKSPKVRRQIASIAKGRIARLKGYTQALEMKLCARMEGRPGRRNAPR